MPRQSRRKIEALSRKAADSPLQLDENFTQAVRNVFAQCLVGGVPVISPVPTFEGAVSEYLKWCSVNNRASTYQTKRSIAKPLLAAFTRTADGKPRDVLGVRPADLEQFKLERRAAGKEPATVNRALAFLKAMYARLAADAQQDDNPLNVGRTELLERAALRIRRVRLLEEPPGRVRSYTPQEERAILRKCHRDLADAFIMSLYTGARRGSLLGIWWEDCDERAGMIHVCRVKGRKAYYVPLHPKVRTVLRRRRAALRRAGKPVTGPVLLSSRGTPWTPDGLQTSMERAFAESGVPNCWFHASRHTFATRARDAGADIRDIAQLLGHSEKSGVKVTARYDHSSSDRLKRIAARIGAKPRRKRARRVSARRPRKSR